MEMEKVLKDLLPLMGVEQDCILSKQGEFTVVFKVVLPEVFTLSDEDYENLHQAWVKAIKVLPKESILHKQDWFMRRQYHADATDKEKSFLGQSSARHFEGRPFLEHDCLLYLTKKPSGRRASSSIFSNLLRPSLVPKENLKPQALREFIDTIGQFQRLLEDTRLIKLTRQRAPELLSSRKHTGIIERYCFLAEDKDQSLYQDISFNEAIHIGDRQLALYTLGDAEDLPALCGSRLTYDTYSTDKTKFPVSFAAGLGLLLNCNHVYNQYILVGDAQQTLKQLEKKRLRLQSLSAYSRENAISLSATNDYLNEAISQQRLPVKAHFNVMVWSDQPDELKDIKNKVASALAGMDAAMAPALEVRVGMLEAGLRELYVAVEGGNAAELAAAMDLARGLLMDAEPDDTVSN